MYCVKCGVRLQDGVESCPLCGTPVWNPEGADPSQRSFSRIYPDPERTKRYPVLGFLTALIVAVDLALLILCLRTYGRVSWSGYVMLGTAVIYLIVFLPLWIDRPHPLVFVPLSFLVIGGYILYICLVTGGKWFLPFAFPVVLILGALTTAAVAMFRYIRHGKLYLIAALFFAIGGSAMLVEMFQSIAFDHPMWTWSLYVVSGFGVVGLFILLAAMIRPLREYLERKFFL